MHRIQCIGYNKQNTIEHNTYDTMHRTQMIQLIGYTAYNILLKMQRIQCIEDTTEKTLHRMQCI